MKYIRFITTTATIVAVTISATASPTIASPSNDFTGNVVNRAVAGAESFGPTDASSSAGTVALTGLGG